MASPTVLRRRIGNELRKMRDERKMPGASVAKAMGWSDSKLSRIESGESPLSDKDAKSILVHYDIPESEIRQFLTLVRRSRQPGWWHSYGDALPRWFQTYIGFEDDASSIRDWQPESIPGLLQTEAYASEVIRAANIELTPDEIEQRAAARTQRQEILDRPNPPRLWSILNESALRRIVGSRSLMREQLLHLVTMAETRPNVTVQVLSFEVGAHAGMGYNFTILSYSDIPGSVVYSEDGTSAVYLDKEPDVARYEDSFQRLVAASTSPERSLAWIKEIAERYGKDA
ncbi:helix-turn-helix transcriptional regulator [Streptomyces sp. MI02-2A]|uniref:helix-turn-helix domain-containing protein n=1 Tax=Streptomyces sp. MI02-2A TaxID=3028688 RepID=UPI0029BACB3A|nr:helix-turn-helix transcriptional regulator [Streptomyces sp. MI02-2A]MDX3260815.1 helix-turn-helix transcriptional regulator [Streptomyces sp. MI02-2A]